jgi:hypothetical protein
VIYKGQLDPNPGFIGTDDDKDNFYYMGSFRALHDHLSRTVGLVAAISIDLDIVTVEKERGTFVTLDLLKRIRNRGVAFEAKWLVVCD